MSRTLHLVQATKLACRAVARCSAVVFVFASLVWSQTPKVPTFESYRITRIYRGAVRPPNFGPSDKYGGSDVSCFGGYPPVHLAMPVNFAGHFVVAACTCGSGCHYFVLWDAENGKVFRDFPFRAINVGPYESAANGPLVEYAGEQYRTDSALFILDGCFEETCDCAKRYYVWSGTQFKLILRRQDQLPPGCEARK
jgi:hypothetical protein